MTTRRFPTPFVATVAAVAAVTCIAAFSWLRPGPPPPISEDRREHTAPSEPTVAPASSSIEAGGPTPTAVPQAAWELSESPFASEDEFLAELARLNVEDKEAALVLAEAGERWYGATGVRAQARRAMAITLLVDLGRMPEARDRTRRFIEKYPRSRYRPLVQGATGIHPRPGRPRG